MILRRLLEAPFMKATQQRAALAWLSGRELEVRAAVKSDFTAATVKQMDATGSFVQTQVTKPLVLALKTGPGPDAQTVPVLQI